MHICPSSTNPDTCNLRVRVVQKTEDPFQGLKGHDYIRARNLDRSVQRVQTSAHIATPLAEVCK